MEPFSYCPIPPLKPNEHEPKRHCNFPLPPDGKQAGKRGVARRRTGLSAGAGSAIRLSCTSRATPRASPPSPKAAPEGCQRASGKPFGRTRRRESPASAPAGAPPPYKKELPSCKGREPYCAAALEGVKGHRHAPFTSRIRYCAFPVSRSRGSGRGTPAPFRCAWRYPWQGCGCPRRSRPRA